MSPTWTERELELKARLQAGEAVVVSLRKGADTACLRAWADTEGLLLRVDRGTDWGNPFEMESEDDRALVCERFEYLQLADDLKLLEAIPELRGKALACWCAPKQCHADTLARLANDEGELSVWVEAASRNAAIRECGRRLMEEQGAAGTS